MRCMTSQSHPSLHPLSNNVRNYLYLHTTLISHEIFNNFPHIPPPPVMIRKPLTIQVGERIYV